MKYLFPLLWILGFGFGAWEVLDRYLKGDRHSPPPVVFIAIWLIGSIVLLIYCRAIKRVAVDDTNLYISNFLQEIAVPLSNVEAVSENRWINQRPVTIRLRSPIRFGKSVLFIPTARLFGLWSANPLVAELRTLAGIGHAEPLPVVPLSAAAARIPGANFIAGKLAAWDRANPKTFITVNVVLCLLAGFSNGVAVLSGGRGIAPLILEVVRDVVLPICAVVVLSGLFGLAQPDTRRAVLRIHGALLLIAALLLVMWMAEINLDGIPRHTPFGWSPGFSELFVCYTMFLATRFTLREDAHKGALVFYLPAWILIPVIVLDVGVTLRFFQLFFSVPQGLQP